MTQDTTLIDQMLEENPLLVFSLYTNIQAKFLERYGTDIIRILDNSVSTHPDGHTVISGAGSDVWGAFWLWVLGAYEVVRVMSEWEECFSEPVRNDLRLVKRMLHRIRIPFAKQELAGGKRDNPRRVYGELSYHSVDGDRKDCAFEIEGTLVWMRPTIEEFRRFILSIRRSDIVGSLPLRGVVQVS